MTLQGTTYPYCSVSDLETIFRDYENILKPETLTGWTVVTGNAQTFSKENSGYFGVIFQDGIKLTEKTSIATVQATASTWWYDETNDILYIHCSDGLDADTHTITGSIETADNFWKARINEAMEEIESYFRNAYPMPFPFAKYSYNSEKYDDDIKIMTGRSAIRRGLEIIDPESPLIAIFTNLNYSEVSPFGLAYEHKSGRRAFSFETAKNDFQGRQEAITFDAASSGRIYLAGGYTGSDHFQMRLKISTAGAVETAYYQVSLDNGLTYGDAIDTFHNLTYLALGLYVRFEGTFVKDDCWLIEVGGDMEQKNVKIKSIRMER